MKCRENTENNNPNVTSRKNEITTLLSKCVVRDIEKFIKQQEAIGLLSNLVTKTLLSKIPLVGPILFQRYYQANTRYKTNEIVNKFLLSGDKFVPEMHLR